MFAINPLDTLDPLDRCEKFRVISAGPPDRRTASPAMRSKAIVD